MSLAENTKYLWNFYEKTCHRNWWNEVRFQIHLMLGQLQNMKFPEKEIVNKLSETNVFY